MTILPRIASLIFNQPLLVLPETAALVASNLAERWDVEPLADIDASRFVGAPREARLGNGETRTVYRLEDGVALINVFGELVNRGAWIGASSGLTSYEGLDAALRAAAGDSAVRAIALDVNSPGGQASGAMETAALVRKIAADKPVAALVNSQAASAAYAIASGATRIITPPSGVLGSIGVVWLHFDRSEAIAKSGSKPTLLTAGAFKADGHPFAALPDDARARIQAQIDQIYGLFVDSVAAYRPMTAKQVRGTEAGTFMGQAAVDAGLADEIGGLDEAFAFLNRGRLSGFSSRRGPFMTEQSPGAAAAAAPIFTQTQFDAAVARAAAASATETRAAALAECAAAMTALFPDHARAETFAEALVDGVPVATAMKFAAKVPLPAPTVVAEPSARTTREKLLDRLAPDPRIGAEHNGGQAQAHDAGADPWDVVTKELNAKAGFKGDFAR